MLLLFFQNYKTLSSIKQRYMPWCFYGILEGERKGKISLNFPQPPVLTRRGVVGRSSCDVGPCRKCGSTMRNKAKRDMILYLVLFSSYYCCSHFGYHIWLTFVMINLAVCDKIFNDNVVNVGTICN